MSLRRAALELLAASFAVLFLELALIRWFGAQVRVVAYFPNLILIASFLGLGLGALRAGRGSLLFTLPPALLAAVGVGFGLSKIAFTAGSANEYLWLLYYDLPKDAPVIESVRLPIMAVFLASAAPFVALGQAVGERLQAFRDAGRALAGYSYDLAGSLLGVAGFAAASFARTHPPVWFAVPLALAAVLFLPRRRLLWLYLAAAAAVVGIVHAADRDPIYSPYYALDVAVDPGVSTKVRANGTLHQVALPLRRAAPAPAGSDHAEIRTGYHIPYAALGRPPGRVLVLGAGTGNDVSVALDNGAEEVHAVEIDPEILAAGIRAHPDRPYASPRVRAFVADARAFLNDSREQYDLIVFGTLDSLTRLSALSNVRLDNFVYTRECLEAARARLSPRGGIVLHFTIANATIDARLAGLMCATLEERPLMVRKYYGLFNRIYMGGPAFAHANPQGREAAAAFMAELPQARSLPTDDWPYLYLRSRGIDGFYLSVMAIVAVLAVAGVALASREMRRSLAGGGGADIEMWLFGLAFLLLETRAVTEMNLAWGATWLTSAVVFASILAVVLLSTLLAAVRPLPFTVAALGLLAALGATYAVPARFLVAQEVGPRLLLSTLYVGAPIFFAAACFALRFKERPAAGLAFGWNLLGAVAGGLVEFASMAVGLKALSLVAGLAYLGAFWIRQRGKNS